MSECKKLRSVFFMLLKILVASTVAIMFLEFCCYNFRLYPPENAIYSNSATCCSNMSREISLHWANLLDLEIALIALIVAIIAFLLPFLIIMVSGYQNYFYKTIFDKNVIDYLNQNLGRKGYVMGLAKHVTNIVTKMRTV